VEGRGTLAHGAVHNPHPCIRPGDIDTKYHSMPIRIPQDEREFKIGKTMQVDLEGKMNVSIKDEAERKI